MALFLRTLLPITLVIGQAVAAAAQQPVASDSWNQMRTLPEHTHLSVVTDQHKERCNLVRVSEEQIVCEHASYSRAEVRSVRLMRHGASTTHGLFVGLGIGAGGGAIAGAALGNSAFNTPGRGAAVGIAIFAPIGAVIGAAVGRTADHASKTIYLR